MNQTKNPWARALAIAQAALQVPMLIYWVITYRTVELESYRLYVRDDGGFALRFDVTRLPRAILVYLPLILALVGVTVLSVLSLMRILRGKSDSRPTLILYGGIVALCGLMLYIFSLPMGIGDQGQYINRWPTSEFMVFRYPFDWEMPHDVWDTVSPFLLNLKYILSAMQIAISGTVCALSFPEIMRHRRNGAQSE